MGRMINYSLAFLLGFYIGGGCDSNTARSQPADQQGQYLSTKIQPESIRSDRSISEEMIRQMPYVSRSDAACCDHEVRPSYCRRYLS